MGTNISYANKVKLLGKIIIRKNVKSYDDKMIFGKLKVREIRTTILLFITVVLFLLAWIPGIVLLVLFRLAPEHVTLGGMLTVYTLSQVNSVFNPYLYAKNIKHAGKIIRKWIGCRCCCTESERITDSSTQ